MTEHTDQPQVPESVLETVRRLVALGQQDSGATEAEREAALARADKLMTKHAIDQALLAASEFLPSREEPEARTMYLWQEGEFTEQYRQLVRDLTAHHRCRAVWHGVTSQGGKYTVIGFPSDIAYFEMVWTGAYLTFVARMDPRWNKAQTEEENVYRLKEAGVRWQDIAEMGGFDWPDGGKIIRIYKRYCREHGLTATNHTQRNAAYRLSYARAFVNRINERIESQVTARHEQVKQTAGAELALRDRADVVNEAMYQRFPNLRPATAAEMEQYRQQSRERMAAELAAEEARRAKLTPKQREAEDRRNERERNRQYRQWDREWAREHDSAGAQAGRSAADTVDLSGGRNAVSNPARPALG